MVKKEKRSKDEEVTFKELEFQLENQQTSSEPSNQTNNDSETQKPSTALKKEQESNNNPNTTSTIAKTNPSSIASPIPKSNEGQDDDDQSPAGKFQYFHFSQCFLNVCFFFFPHIRIA